MPEAIKQLIEGMNNKNEPEHIRDNYRTRLKDISDVILKVLNE